jgi:hypothetical protein
VSRLERIAVILSLAAGVVSCRRAPAPSVFLDPALAVLIPSDTTFVAGVRLQKLRANAGVDALLSRSPRLLQFRKNMGLPPDSDIWEFLVTSNGTGWLALMRGKFTEMGMEPHLDKPGAARLTHGGITVLGDERGAVAFLNPTTAIAGRIDDVIRALDQRNDNTGVPATLEKLVNRIPGKYELWFASSGSVPDFVEAKGVRAARGGLNLATRTYDLVVEADSGSQDVEGAPAPDSAIRWVTHPRRRDQTCAIKRTLVRPNDVSC